MEQSELCGRFIYEVHISFIAEKSHMCMLVYRLFYSSLFLFGTEKALFSIVVCKIKFFTGVL